MTALRTDPPPADLEGDSRFETACVARHSLAAGLPPLPGLSSVAQQAALSQAVKHAALTPERECTELTQLTIVHRAQIRT